MSLLPSTLHLCAANEHVPKVERCIRTLKERTRTVCHTLPYKMYTRSMTRGLVEHVRKWINAFPSNAGIIGNYSPANIVEGVQNPDCNRKRVAYGAYIHAYCGTTNNMRPRTTPAIALHESNVFDGQYFMSLDTGRRIHSKKWTRLPIDSMAIDRIVSIATKEKLPILSSNVPSIEWAPGLDIDPLPYIDESEDDVIAEPARDDLSSMMDVPNDDDRNIISEDDDDGVDDEDSSQPINNNQENIVIEDVDDDESDVVLHETEKRAGPYVDEEIFEPFEKDDGSCDSADFSFNMEAGRRRFHHRRRLLSRCFPGCC